MDDQTQPSGELPPEYASTTSDDTPPIDTQVTQEARDARAALTPDMEAEYPESGAVPPGYDWPTHGGYLGCLLAMLPACLIAGFLSSTFVAWPWFNGKSNLHPVVASLIIVLLFVVSVYGFGRIGWVLGRRFYRKYPRSEPSWGEDDVVPEVSVAPQPGEARDQATQ